MTHSTATIYHVGAARDAHGVDLRPASVVIRRGKLLQISRPTQVRRADFPESTIVHLPEVLVLPRMVNAHAHLDLSSMSPVPYHGSFDQWLGHVMCSSPCKDDAATVVKRGWKENLEAGVGMLGDIARFPESVDALASAGAGYHALSFLELFGQGKRQAEAITALERSASNQALISEKLGMATGLQPHAPYSAGLGLYHAAVDAAAKHRLRLCTHLAETLDEDEFVRSATGKFAALLKKLDKWDETILPAHVSPVQWLSSVLSRAHWLVAHCNYVSDEDLDILASTQTSVAYCPVASDYFGHENHRYREMLARGINVCLGTDSIICQPAGVTQPHGIMAQMRHLYLRDGTAPATLLEMATTRGAKALGADIALVTLQVDSPGDVMAIPFDPHVPADALVQALRSKEPLTTLQSFNMTESSL